MKRITPDLEKKLVRSVEKTAELVAAGEHPNTAITKIAEADALRPGDVELVVRAYNTGQTLRQYRDAGDPHEKAASFELADADTVLERLFPSRVKTAAATYEETAVSPEYNIPPTAMLSRRRNIEKQAAAVARELPAAPKPAPYAKENTKQIERDFGVVRKTKRAMEESRRQVSAARDAFDRSMIDLGDYFQRTDAIPLHVVEKTASAVYGNMATVMLGQLRALRPGLLKLARHRQGVGIPYSGEPDLTEAPFTLINNVLSAVETYNKKQAEFDSCAEASRVAVSTAVTPHFSAPFGDSVLSGTTKSAKIAESSMLGAIGGYTLLSRAAEDISEKLKKPEPDKQVASVMDDLDDPAHEGALMGINAQSSLQDLMSNDPVISGYPPQEVSSAYNDLVQISPSIADQRMLLQSLLRKKLEQGSFDTFEQDQLLGFEDKLRKQTTPTGGDKGFKDGG